MIVERTMTMLMSSLAKIGTQVLVEWWNFAMKIVKSIELQHFQESRSQMWNYIDLQRKK